VRLLHARHRLALSGTPIENHLGELWSLFEFLNPGLLGAASVFRRAGAGAARATRRRHRSADTRSQAILSSGGRRSKWPAICRPSSNNHLLRVDTVQRKLYDQLRDHYRQTLVARIERDGMARSKIHILEALLRLRQAACHPGLVDKARVAESSTKLGGAALATLNESARGGSQGARLLAVHELARHPAEEAGR